MFRGRGKGQSEENHGCGHVVHGPVKRIGQLATTYFRDNSLKDVFMDYFYLLFFSGIHWVTHGYNFVPIPYPFILRV